jgi:predicted dehydrogenase
MNGPVRIGVVGAGNMGCGHIEYLLARAVKGGVLAAICDNAPTRLAAARTRFGEGPKYFADTDTMLNSGTVDGVIIATPHYDHPPIAIAAFKHGVHVLSEKPAGVYTRQVREMNQAAAESGLVFGIMFQLRTIAAHQKMRELVQSGELGPIQRVEYVVTDWLRTQVYYDNGGWRGTWAGEGGGVLMNQCPHNLDLLQWICGMPQRILAFCRFGQYHKIETEDDVTAMLEWSNGATGIFVTTTGEAPGVSRMEVIGDRGRLLMENGAITFFRTRLSVEDQVRTSPLSFPRTEWWKCDIPTGADGDGHRAVTRDWVNAILHGKPMLARGEEGIHGVTLANAMLMSTWTKGWIDLPLDEEVYYRLLQERVAKSTWKTAAIDAPVADLAGSYAGSR